MSLFHYPPRNPYPCNSGRYSSPVLDLLPSHSCQLGLSLFYPCLLGPGQAFEIASNTENTAAAAAAVFDDGFAVEVLHETNDAGESATAAAAAALLPVEFVNAIADVAVKEVA